MGNGRFLAVLAVVAAAGFGVGQSDFGELPPPPWTSALDGIAAPAAGAAARLAATDNPPVSASGWGQHTPRSPRDPEAGEAAGSGSPGPQVRASVVTDFQPRAAFPRVHDTAWLDPMSSVIGDVVVGERSSLSPFASIRGDRGGPVHVGRFSNLADGAVIDALETRADGQPIADHLVSVHGDDYAVYVGDRVTLAHQSVVHGPAWVEDEVFVGMQALVFRARIGRGSVVEPGAKVIGVEVPPGRYVPAGMVVSTQPVADTLPEITWSYGLREVNPAAVRARTALGEAYRRAAEDDLPAAPQEK